MAGRGRELTMPAWMKKQMQQQGGQVALPPRPAAGAAAAPIAQPPMAAYRQQQPQQYQQHAAPVQQQYHQAYQQPQPPQQQKQPQQYVPMHLQAPPAAAPIAVPPQFADAPEPPARESKEPARDSRSTSERNGASSKRDDAHREKSSRRSSRSRERERDRRERSSSRHRRHRSSKSSRSSKDRSRSRSPGRSRSRDRRSTRDRNSRDHSTRDRRSSRRSSRSRSDSRDRVVRRRKKSHFDVLPPGVTQENAAAYAAQAILQQNLAALAASSGSGSGNASSGAGGLGHAAFAPPLPPSAPVAPSPYGPMATGMAPPTSYGGGGHSSGGGNSNSYSQQTRHARRLYVGGIGEVTEPEITEFFNDVIDRALGVRQDGGAVVSVYINRERHFAFVELRTIELTTACMNLDGVAFRGMPLKIRRPNDYNPATVPTEVGPIPTLNLAALGIVSTTVPDGPGKVFIGGLPYHLNEEQVKELLQAFGPLKSFHLVKELSSNMSKGYGFCEYLNPTSTDEAVLGLNNMQLGDKTLTVRRAMPQENAPRGPGGPSPMGHDMGSFGHPQQLQHPAHAAAMQAIGMAGLAPPAGPPGPRGPPSRVVVLLNMVTPEELEDDDEFVDIVDDIKSECERFGRVVSIVLPRPRDGATTAVGKVFVEYDAVASAQAAAAELHGRGFSNRTVVVEFMDEQQYARREFA